MKDYEPIIQYIKSALSTGRYLHSLSVADTAVKLGEALGLDGQTLDKLYEAGLLHDCTKELTVPEQLEIIKAGGGQTESDDLSTPQVLHQLSGAYRARALFGVDDEIFGMIRYHCTGKAGMSLCECIIFLSDYIEPTRTHPSCVKLREEFYSRPISESSVRDAVRASCAATVEHLKKKQYPIHHLTLDTCRG